MMLDRDNHASRPIDKLRPGLLQVMLQRLSAFNANSRLLLKLLEEPDWRDLGARAFARVRQHVMH